MSELVSAARIGRSLGVHLILATQKPTGVVDDQIWSNSKFKLALKVQNEADSKEILKRQMQQTLRCLDVPICKWVIMKSMNCSNLRGVELLIMKKNRKKKSMTGFMYSMKSDKGNW